MGVIKLWLNVAAFTSTSYDFLASFPPKISTLNELVDVRN